MLRSASLLPFFHRRMILVLPNRKKGKSPPRSLLLLSCRFLLLLLLLLLLLPYVGLTCRKEGRPANNPRRKKLPPPPPAKGASASHPRPVKWSLVGPWLEGGRERSYTCRKAYGRRRRKEGEDDSRASDGRGRGGWMKTLLYFPTAARVRHVVVSPPQ